MTIVWEFSIKLWNWLPEDARSEMHHVWVYLTMLVVPLEKNDWNMNSISMQ